ncbi:hypothetical protein D8674_037919 [Pyrus ussuriensis x Pyrus communis]|uniref:Uncharacterized protein n=1 Tax=Pyrus ussuriensis x Pyrus communis TaxID=2448454 RepID=A0A5N5FPJ0_9ROSA|nr:hypothetical protein D8674_037919 [Pyrus ussuriensis x Pyrus communis]
MHYPCFVEIIERRKNMIPAITRWDTSMIHKVIKNVPVEKIKNIENIIGLDQNVINNEQENDNININEAQTEFKQLFGEEMIKLDAIAQKHIIDMDTTMSEELFDEFKKAMSITEKRYITFREMMAYLVDTSNKKCLIFGQINKMLNNEIEKLLRKLMTNANTLKINDYLNHIGVLKMKLEKKPSLVPNAAEIQVHMKTPIVEPIPNATDMEVQMETPTAKGIPNVAQMEVQMKAPISDDVQKDDNKGKEYVTEGKVRQEQWS